MLEKRKAAEDSIIEFSDTSGDNEIKRFVDKTYGEDCTLGDKRDLGNGLSEIEVKTDKKTACGNGYAYFFYNSSTKKVIAFIYGQVDCKRPTQDNLGRCQIINEIKNSFRAT